MFPWFSGNSIRSLSFCRRSIHNESKNIEVITLKKEHVFDGFNIHVGFAYLMEIAALLHYYN